MTWKFQQCATRLRSGNRHVENRERSRCSKYKGVAKVADSPVLGGWSWFILISLRFLEATQPWNLAPKKTMIRPLQPWSLCGPPWSGSGLFGVDSSFEAWFWPMRMIGLPLDIPWTTFDPLVKGEIYTLVIQHSYGKSRVSWGKSSYINHLFLWVIFQNYVKLQYQMVAEILCKLLQSFLAFLHLNISDAVKTIWHLLLGGHIETFFHSYNSTTVGGFDLS
jgi:hypothetical protein